MYMWSLFKFSFGAKNMSNWGEIDTPTSTNLDFDEIRVTPFGLLLLVNGELHY